jgi:hypothetical protein
LKSLMPSAFEEFQGFKVVSVLRVSES